MKHTTNAMCYQMY